MRKIYISIEDPDVYAICYKLSYTMYVNINFQGNTKVTLLI